MRSTVPGQLKPDACHGNLKNKDNTPAGAPRKPPYITGRAAEIWDRVVSDLMRHKLCSTIDVESIAAYCREATTMEEFSTLIEKNGGLDAWIMKLGVKAKIALDVDMRLRKCMDSVVKLACMLGLNATGRKRLARNAPNEAPDDEINTFLKRVK